MPRGFEFPAEPGTEVEGLAEDPEVIAIATTSVGQEGEFLEAVVTVGTGSMLFQVDKMF